MKEKVSKSYPLDNSAIIHLASMRKGYTNFFRVAAVLTNSVFPEVFDPKTGFCSVFCLYG